MQSRPSRRAVLTNGFVLPLAVDLRLVGPSSADLASLGRQIADLRATLMEVLGRYNAAERLLLAGTGDDAEQAALTGLERVLDDLHAQIARLMLQAAAIPARTVGDFLLKIDLVEHDAAFAYVVVRDLAAVLAGHADA
jgi:hypothetical protein